MPLASAKSNGPVNEKKKTIVPSSHNQRGPPFFKKSSVSHRYVQSPL